MTTLPRSRRRLHSAAGIAVLALLFGWLLSRAMGLTPTIFADEWYYSRMARLVPLDQAMVPSYLYLWLFGATNACGDGFLDCVRGANALLFVAAAPFLYLSARQVAGRAAAAAIALLATLAPLNVYVAYFMPESAYYFGFAVLSWAALAGRTWRRPLQALAAGLVLGLMSLVKVHALFLLPSLCLYFVYLAWSEDGAWVRRALLAVVLTAGACLGVKFGLGWLLAGDAGLSLFGPFYGAAASNAGGNRLAQLLHPLLASGAGHLMAVALLDGLPLAMLAFGLLRLPRRADTGPAALLRAYTFLMLGAAAGMTVMYTASLAAAGIASEALRLHLRYYSFTFPLLWMVAVAGSDDARRAPALRWVLALLLATVAVLAWFKLPGYSLNTVDSPEIGLLRPGTPAAAVVATLQLAALLLWAAGSARARQAFMVGVVGVSVLSCIPVAHRVLDAHHVPNPADKAGMYAHRFLPAADRGRITLAGSDVAELMRAQFHLDHPDTPTLELPSGAPIAPYQMPTRSKWLVVFGNHPLPPGVRPAHVDPDFVVVRLDNRRKVLGRTIFSRPLGQDLVASAEGLSVIEGFGRWSDARQVVLHLNRPLPKSGLVLIKAMSYGDNSEKNFILRSGASSASFRITGSMQEVAIPFETDGAQRTLAIEVPHPVSPSEVGGADTRKLGIALAEIEIATRAD
jgi:phosphoglycerol transferase